MKILLALLFSLLCFAEDKYLYWLPHGCDVGVKGAKSAGHAHSGMQTIMYQLNGMDGSMHVESTYILPTLEQKPLEMKANLTNLVKSPYDNYHAIVANAEKDDQVYSAIFYLYKFGRPSGESPKKLTDSTKSPLEIVPLPLPREHDRYRGSSSYRFQILFQGKPVANEEVVLETLSGFSATFKSDSHGIATVTLPNDFEDVKDSRSENMPSYFILKTKLGVERKAYLSTLSMPYHVNPTDYWQNQKFGALAIGGGFLIGFAFMTFRGRRDA